MSHSWPCSHRPTDRPSDRPTVSPSGFTLIEVLTALAITGVVALLAHRLLNVTIDAVHQLDQARVEQDRIENGRRWLRSAFLSLDVGDSAGGFEGLQQHVTFSSWIEQPGGWSELERLTIELRDGRTIASGNRAGSLLLADSTTSLAFDYLLEPGASTRWVQAWLSPLSSPLAVRMRLTRKTGRSEESDTLLFLIKERG